MQSGSLQIFPPESRVGVESPCFSELAVIEASTGDAPKTSENSKSSEFEESKRSGGPFGRTNWFRKEFGELSSFKTENWEETIAL